MSERLTVAGIQANLLWENKKGNLEMFEKRIASIPTGTDIVVLPEMFTTGFSMNPAQLAETMEGDTVKWMKKTAAQKKIIVTGSLIISEGENYYNRLLWVLPNAQLAYYDKRHLFAYGDEDRHYTAGAKRLIASVNGWRINLLVCYDLRFPVWSRQNPVQRSGPLSHAGDMAPEFDVLIYVANWPERRIHAWKTLLQARAIENQCYVVGVNRVGEDGQKIFYSGESMAVDPAGEVLYHRSGEEDVFQVTFEKAHLEKIRDKFPFWKSADRFQILAG